MTALASPRLERVGAVPRLRALSFDVLILGALMAVTYFLFRTPLLLPFLGAAYFYSEVLVGYSPGKRIEGLIVLDEDAGLAGFETLKHRWRIKTGVVTASILFSMLLADFRVSEAIAGLVRLPAFLVAIGAFSVFGRRRQAFYDWVSNTAVFKTDSAMRAAAVARLREAALTRGRYFRTESGIFNAQGNFSWPDTWRFLLRTVKARMKSFFWDWIIGGVLRLGSAMLGGGDQRGLSAIPGLLGWSFENQGLCMVGGGATAATAWHFFTGIGPSAPRGGDWTTTLIIAALPIFLVALREPLDLLLRPFEALTRRMPRRLLIISALAAPFALSALFCRHPDGGPPYAAARNTVIWSVLISHVLFRAPTLQSASGSKGISGVSQR